MKRLYRIFKSECPSGLITEEVFYNIFSKFFPLGAGNYNGKNLCSNFGCLFLKKIKRLFSANMSSYSHYVFTALAQEEAQVVTFEVRAISQIHNFDKAMEMTCTAGLCGGSLSAYQWYSGRKVGVDISSL